MIDLEPKEPLEPGWTKIAPWSNGAGWQKGRLCVISTVAVMELPAGGGTGPTWLVSVSIQRDTGNRRAKDHEVRRALAAFGMREAEEDNHEPGIARKFFMPFDRAQRGICECKTDESVIVEADGYTYSTRREVEPET